MGETQSIAVAFRVLLLRLSGEAVVLRERMKHDYFATLHAIRGI